MHPLAILLAASLSIAHPSAPARSEPAGFDWLQFGKELRLQMCSEVKRATPLTQIHHLTEQTAGKLWGLSIPPNYDQGGRERAQRRFGVATLGTCGHTATCLQQVWLGAGIPQSAMATAVVLKRRGNGQLAAELNADHAALVYLHPDGPLVFDLWCAGREHTTFFHFRTSVWKGMPLAEWGRRMALEGYTVASFQEYPQLGETTPYEFADLIRRLSSR